MPDDLQPNWLVQFYTASKPSELAESDAVVSLPKFAVSSAEKFRIDQEMGRGGMKSVLRAFDRNTSRDIAMAVVLDGSARAKAQARFVREARITAALEHPNIVPIYDIGLDETGKPYFTMKMLGGETLESILQRVYAGDKPCRTRYCLEELLRIFQGICNGMAFAHSRGVLHLDLKPANIQVGDFGEVLILDWGLAKVFETDAVRHPQCIVLDEDLREVAPGDGVVAGTPGFMSPEQARGENASLDERTDIFALGAILCAILHCRECLGRKNPPDATRVPRALEAVVAKAMADAPADRYRSVEELARDVRAYVDGYATAAQRAGALTLLWLLIKRHSVVTSLTTVSLVTVFALLWMHFIQIRSALEKIKAEQESKYQVGLLAAPNVLLQAQQDIQALDFDQALARLEQVVTMNKDSTEAWETLAALHMGRQDFTQAAVAFSHLPKPDPTPPEFFPANLQDVLEKYAHIRREDGEAGLRRMQDDFVHDLIKARHTAWPYLQLAGATFFKARNRDLRTADFGLIEKVLRWTNPEEPDLKFTHESTPAGVKVAIHGRGVSEIFPLAGLPVSILDAANTGDLALRWMRDAPLIRVDLSGSETWDLNQLTANTTLQELRLTGWRRKDYNQLRAVLQVKRVIVDSTDVPAVAEALKHVAAAPEVTGEAPRL